MRLGKLSDIVVDNQDEIVDAVVDCTMKGRHAPEQIIRTIMEEIKLNKEQVIREGIVNAELIDTGIRSFLTDVNVQQGISFALEVGVDF